MLSEEELYDFRMEECYPVYMGLLVLEYQKKRVKVGRSISHQDADKVKTRFRTVEKMLAEKYLYRGHGRIAKLKHYSTRMTYYAYEQLVTFMVDLGHHFRSKLAQKESPDAKHWLYMHILQHPVRFLDNFLRTRDFIYVRHAVRLAELLLTSTATQTK